VRRHDDAGLRSVLAGLPGAFSGFHAATRVEIARVFTDVPTKPPPVAINRSL
jgi:hypothetical protein